jgi:hypothetical protein
MCVGVYGASQAGKSYMVSALAREKGKQLIAVMGPHEVDFIKTINPPGGQESTGLVTRFTTEPIVTPDGFPIKLRLLSEIDLVKLLFNSYASDILPSESDNLSNNQEVVEKALLELDTALKEDKSPVKVEDIFDLEDYVSSNNSLFMSNVRIQSIKKTRFWSRAADLLPKVGLDRRLSIYQLLWEGLDIYNSLFMVLARELERLEHSTELYCEASALFVSEASGMARATKSIINVTTLENLGQPDPSFIKVSTKDAKVHNISVSNLTALISELQVSIKNRPHEMFNSTDLLDFPGARSRRGHPKDAKILAEPQVKVENFLRGKVAYLFDKYCTNYELTIMLLCVGPSNQEVVGLDRLIDDWVERTHGAKPDQRSLMPTSLFLVLTKFDKEFAQDAGREIDGERWSTRLQASLIKPFAAHSHRTNWVNNWDNNGAFKNIFWLRNPHADQSGLIDYAGNPGGSEELGVCHNKRELVAQLRQSFVVNPDVTRHFDSPGHAWDAGLSLNDGGCSYLIKKLSPTCDPVGKLQQINQNLNTIIVDVSLELRKYYVSGNLEEILSEKQKIAKDLRDSMARVIEKDKLGEFIYGILTNDSDTALLFKNVNLDYERQHSSQHSDAGEKSAENEISKEIAELLEYEFIPSVPNEDHSAKSLGLKFPDKFIIEFIQHWRIQVLQRFASSASAEYMGLNRDLLSKLLNELEISARRSGLIGELKRVIENKSQYQGIEKRTWLALQAAGVSVRFNQFLCFGGNRFEVDAGFQVSLMNGKTITLFQPSKSEDPTDLTLPERAPDTKKIFFRDWVLSLVDAVRNNAEFISGTQVDVDSNRKLGEILHSYRQTLEEIANG